MTEDYSQYTVMQARQAMRAKTLTAVELVQACLHRITRRDAAVRAWQFISADSALAQAEQCDRERSSKPLQGIPVGIKDIIDTAAMPTTYGSSVYAGHQPQQDADCVKRLQAAGAIIVGKTVSTEFAYLHPGQTRNPHDLARSPGGSSSGSAAAVADYQVPLALATQTAGSIIRPASYCGVVAYKPTFDSFPFKGIHAFAPTFDTLGAYSRSVADMLIIRGVLAGGDAASEPAAPWKTAIVRGPYWSAAQPETEIMLESLEAKLSKGGRKIQRVDLGPEFEGLNAAQRTVMLAEGVESLQYVYAHKRERLSALLRADYEKGLQLTKQSVAQARELIESSKRAIAGVFSEYDLILTPSAAGYAPQGLASTGDPVFNKMWTALHLPCVNLPFSVQPGELPLGIQAVAAVNKDAHLLAYAAWLEAQLHRIRYC